MRNELRLLEELNRVGRRYRRMLLLGGLTACWAVLALAGVALVAWSRRSEADIPGIVLVLFLAVPLIAIPLPASAWRRMKDPRWIARRVERRFPELDTRLLAALEHRPKQTGEPLGFLQDSIVLEVLEHERRTGWDHIVPPRGLRLANWAHAGVLLLFASVMWTLIGDMRQRPATDGASWWLGGLAEAETPFEITVEPQDASIERGASLLVLARFKGKLPDNVQLLYRDGAGAAMPAAAATTQPGDRQMPMSKSLDDPLFAGRVPSVTREMTYAVKYGDAQTKWYQVSVFDFPELQRADAKLAFPAYTKLPEAVVEDTRSVTAVEGTKATLTFRLNKPVAEATLLPVNASTTQPAVAPVALAVDPESPNVYKVEFDLRQSQRYRLKLVDKDGREAKLPAELAINVTQNRPPDLKLEFPGRDVDVSPLEELSTRAQVWDDFGVARVGLSYSMGGETPRDLVLAHDVAGKERRAVSHLLALEALSAKPDDLLSYFFWVEDVGPDGQVRRSSGDMFFAEVRPFEEIFRQGEQPTGDEQQQQQQQQQGQGQNAQQAEELSELQKQIIAATWKVIRRETSTTPTQQFAPDAKLLAESQQSAKQQATALAERVEDPRSRAFVNNVLRHMDKAIAELAKAAAERGTGPLASALAAEQQAYQELLKLRAREHDVVRGNRQQQRQQGQSQSSASARRQRQLDQLELQNQDNRYANQRNAPQQPQQEQGPAQREQRQVLNRLRELAQRQEDLNRQMRDLQSALEQSRDQQQREELQRQLARLRDQQQQMLRDTDELRDRMDRPENQERMAESRQQMEQTRTDVRRASEALEQGMVPEASSAGARAAEQLNTLRDRVRQSASGEFNEQMDRMRQDARNLDQRQQDLSQRLAEMDGVRTSAQSATQPAPQRGLRDSGERAQTAQELGQQKQQLQQLLDNMKRTVEEAETSQPLLSRQLYDAAREAGQGRADQALDATRQLLERGFVSEAREAEGEATRGITKLRDGVERAAQGVLGDEAEALRRARNQLDALSQELDREMGRPGAPGGGAGVASAATQPTTRTAQLANADRRGERAGNEPSTRASAGGQPREGERQGQQARSGEPQRRQPGEQSGDPQEGEQPQAGGPQGQEGQQGQPGEGQQGQARGQQPGGQQQQQQGEGQQGQGQQEQSGGQQPGGQQEGQPGPGGGGTRPGQGQQQAQAGGRGNEGAQESPQGDGEPQADARGEGRGLRQQPGDQPGQQPGDANPDAQARDGQTRDGQARDGQARGSGGGGNNPRGDLRQFLDDNTGGADGGGSTNPNARGPLTGGNFREWSDRLRDVEEMVTDPGLRAEAARIRDRARAIRAEFERHSTQPNWDIVRDTVGQPIVELRQKVQEELLRKESKDALVPIDREPVPANYAEQVRRYYERLGSGR